MDRLVGMFQGAVPLDRADMLAGPSRLGVGQLEAERPTVQPIMTSASLATQIGADLPSPVLIGGSHWQGFVRSRLLCVTSGSVPIKIYPSCEDRVELRLMQAKDCKRKR